MTVDDSELDIAYTRFLAIMKDWFHLRHYVLKDTNSTKIDPLEKTAERLRNFRKKRAGSGNPNLRKSVANRNSTQ
jgi:signal recognition particle subunit SEC65